MTKTKLIDGYSFVSYVKETYQAAEMQKRSKEFYEWMDTRRTVRDFSDKSIPKEVIENIILTASSAPSGAHKQPWTFCVVSDPSIKKQIRTEAEKEEYESENGEAPTLYDRSKFQESLEKMIHEHDANIGISWDTVDIYLNEYCKI